MRQPPAAELFFAFRLLLSAYRLLPSAFRSPLCCAILAQGIPAVLACGSVHRQHVFHRHEGLNVVNGIKHEPSAGAEGSDPFANFLPDFLRCAKGKSALSIHAPAPECDPITKFAFQVIRIHMRGGALHGIKDVEPRRDEISH